MTAGEAMVKCDWDRTYMPTMRWLVRRLHRAGYQPVAFGFRRSPSGRGWHGWWVVSPRPRSRAEVVALQLLLGSDPKREARTLLRSRVRTPAFARSWWNVLYQPMGRG